MTRSTSQHLTAVAKQETSHVTGNDTAFDILHLYILKATAIVCLQSTIHTHIEQAVTVLYHTVHVVAGHALLRVLFFLNGMKLIAIIPIQTISSDDPNKAVTVQIDLIGIAARQLFVSIKYFARLSIDAQW